MTAFHDVPLCLSGGAKGADAQWGMTAGMAGHQIIHWSYAGASVHVPEQEVVRLSDEQLQEADPYLVQANKTLRRKLNFKAGWINLLRRNWYQVKDSTSVYAVADLKDGEVTGGTAWAVQMFMDRLGAAQPLPIYVFAQSQDRWFCWNGLGGWMEMSAPPPPPDEIYAGIGSRDLLPNGKQAIRTLMGYKGV